MSGIDKSPMQEEYENALKGDMDLDKKIIKLGELNKLAYEDLILSIKTNSSVGKVAFRLVRNANSVDFPKGKSKITQDRLVSKCAPYMALSLLKLKSEFHIVSWS